MSTILSGSFTATGESAWKPVRRGRFNYSIGQPGQAFEGTVLLERSFDGGTTATPVSFNDGSLAQWTANAGSYGEEVEGSEDNPVLYRFRCSSFASGPIYYRLGQ